MSNNNSSKYKIAIIGAGASGLSAAYKLNQLGFNVDLYEKSSKLGGLAGAVELSKGSLDSFYHHLFKSDKYILNFLKEINLDHNVIFKRTSTGHIWNNNYYDISSIFKFRKSNLLSNWGLFRLLIGGALIKYLPTNRKINNKFILKIIDKLFGNEAGSRIWKPLLESKFGEYAKLMPYSWLRTRIQDRSVELGYISKGFEVIYNHLAKEIAASKGNNIFINKEVEEIKLSLDSTKLIINGKIYDRAIITTSPKINSKLLKKISYRANPIKYLGALCGILEFDKRPIPSYWLGIAESSKENKKNYSNFLAAISYAELDETWNKSGKPTWPLYLASYCNKEYFYKYSENEWKTKMIKAAIELNKLSKIDVIKDNNLINFKLSFAEYAQPILSPKSDLYPNPESAKFCYFANMHNIFPNDRGQNRAFYIGNKVANLIYKDLIN